ncbi:sigma-70 family RNA polymerase sigma factor [soil metagenome]
MAETILNRIAEGDKTAVQDCLNKFGGLVWSLARRMCPNKDDAEDAVQEIFIDVWKNAGRFDENQASETTFIAMIARRRLIDRLRKFQRQPNIDSFEDILAEPAEYSNKQIETSIEANEAAKALSILRPEQRQILQLSIIQGFSHQEIANVLKMPLGTVKTHARRGLLQVREFLGVGNTENGKEASV